MKDRVEESTSRTAAMTCSIRAGSFYEHDACLHSDDYIAPRILPHFVQPLVKSRLIRKTFMRLLSPEGIYEYVIARTKYIDLAVHTAMEEGVRQIVLLGAGYDSRAVRFFTDSPETVFFELDTPALQTAKRGQYQKRGIVVQSNCRFVPVHFGRESVEQKLLESGFDPGESSLFILEGVLMYLPEETVQETLSIMQRLMSRGSRAVADVIYQSVLRREDRYYGEEDISRRVSKYGEAWKFGIEESGITEYFRDQGFTVAEEADTALLHDRFFNGDDRYRINGTHCIVTLQR
jgi:methyltransferase (TIGR00027 family)